MSISLPRFGKFSAINSLNKLSVTFSFVLLLLLQNFVCRLFLLMACHCSHWLLHDFSLFCLFVVVLLNNFKGLFTSQNLLFDPSDATFSIAIFTHCILHLQNLFLVLFYNSVSVRLPIVLKYCFPDSVELSFCVFS